MRRSSVLAELETAGELEPGGARSPSSGGLYRPRPYSARSTACRRFDAFTRIRRCARRERMPGASAMR